MPSSPVTCLIVEDSDLDRLMLRRVLAQLDPTLRHVLAATLAEAKQKLDEGGIDFMLLDNSLPDGNGADFVLTLARDPILSRIPVLIVTGWPSPFLFAKANAARVRKVVAKDQLKGKAVTRLFQDCIEAARRNRPHSEQAHDMRTGASVAQLTERQLARLLRRG